MATRSKKRFEQKVLVWRVVNPSSVDPRTPRILMDGCDEVTFGLMLPRCFVIMLGRNAGSPAVLHRTHQEKDEVSAAQSLFDMTEMIVDRQKGMLVVPPQTIVVPLPMDEYDWDAVPDEWAEGIFLPMVDELHAKEKAA